MSNGTHYAYVEHATGKLIKIIGRGGADFLPYLSLNMRCNEAVGRDLLFESLELLTDPIPIALSWAREVGCSCLTWSHEAVRPACTVGGCARLGRQKNRFARIFGFPPIEDDGIPKDSSFLPNEMLLSLFHGCLQHDLSDREIMLSGTDHTTFMEQVLQRDRDGHPAPFMLPVVQGKRTCMQLFLPFSIPLMASDHFTSLSTELPKASVLPEHRDPASTYHSVGSKDRTTSAITQQVQHPLDPLYQTSKDALPQRAP